jgi:hypothetical protein
MARSFPSFLAAAAVLMLAPAAVAQSAVDTAPQVETPPSMDCGARSVASVPAPLKMLNAAMREKRPVRLLLLGPSSAAGFGASSYFATYPRRLEAILERIYKGTDFDIIRRGFSREIGEDQIDRVKNEIADTAPDLVVWQVGGRDAMIHAEVEDFTAALRGALRWLAENTVDVVLVEPPYNPARAGDLYYLSVVEAVQNAAALERVALVKRFAAMRELARNVPDDDTADRLYFNDRGYRCLPRYIAQTISGGVKLAEQAVAGAR